MVQSNRKWSIIVRQHILLFVIYFVASSGSKIGYAQYKEQSNVYEIWHGDRKIGTLVAIMISDGKKKVYRLETHVDVKMVFSVKADVVVRNTFIDEILSEASAKRVVNNSLKLNNTILRHGEEYRMTTKDQETLTHQGVIRKCVSQLYFEEPLNQTSLFSEAFLEYMPLVKAGKSTYELKLPDGKINQYTYSEGLCKFVTIETQLSSVNLKLVASSIK